MHPCSEVITEGVFIHAWEQGEVLHVGAEAEVSSGSFLGLPAVRKVRRQRAYRHPDLDRRLTRQRMLAEARMLTRLSSSHLPTPALLAFEESSGVMVLSLMPGRQLVDTLRDENPPVERVMRSCGEVIRHLHSLGGVHGDLTTNNMLWDEHSGVSIIDFGLSQWTTDVEKMGLDLQVISECLNASHPEHERALEWLFEGYLSAKDLDYHGSDAPPRDAAEVVERYHEIRGRVRYHA